MHKMWAIMVVCDYMIPNAIAQTGRVPVRLEEADKKSGLSKTIQQTGERRQKRKKPRNTRTRTSIRRPRQTGPALPKGSYTNKPKTVWSKKIFKKLQNRASIPEKHSGV